MGLWGTEYGFQGSWYTLPVVFQKMITREVGPGLKPQLSFLIFFCKLFSLILWPFEGMCFLTGGQGSCEMPLFLMWLLHPPASSCEQGRWAPAGWLRTHTGGGSPCGENARVRVMTGCGVSQYRSLEVGERM